MRRELRVDLAQRREICLRDIGCERSPVTGGRATLIERIPFERIACNYKKRLNFDISLFYKDIDEVLLFECLETGYRFFTPEEMSGSPEFYNALYGDGGNASWAYRDHKWEYEAAGALVSGSQSLLDVGSGGGQFLNSLEEKVGTRCGLETNPLGRTAAVKLGLSVYDETVEAHAGENRERYDAVTALQVLEHVYDLKGFIEGCLAVLKPGGLLVISVPNNDGFVGVDTDLPLNMPPHHMGRWGRKSLTSITRHFCVSILTLDIEPLQEKNIGWYQALMEARYLPHSRIIRSLYYRMGLNKSFSQFLRENRNTIAGHTILAAYQKNPQ